MDRQQAKELMPIIQAFAEGKTIQAAGGRGWYDVDNINFNSCKYRIKPEPKYRPFNDAEECWQEMQKHQPFGWVKYKEEKSILHIAILIVIVASRQILKILILLMVHPLALKNKQYGKKHNNYS